MRVATLISLAATWGAVQCSGVVHCQPGDPGCSKCQASCDTIELGALPECCEVYSACCPTYSNQCRSCEANTAIDPHFPEYCCASFTDCCHLVPGLALAPGFSARQGSDSASKKEGQHQFLPGAVPAAGGKTSQPDEISPSSTTLHTASVLKTPEGAGAQNSPPAGRGSLAAPASPNPFSDAPQLPSQPRARQRSVGQSSSGSVRPTPAARKVAETATISRRGRVTSRGRVAQ